MNTKNSDLDKLIPEHVFATEWGILLKESGDLYHFDEVKDQPENHVWTILESEDDADGNWYAAPGFHYVNKLGYILTQKPWADDTLDAIYFLDD